MQAIQAPKYDYSQHTVKELKEMAKKNNAIVWVNGQKKADYIKALEDHDSYEQDHINTMKTFENFGENLKKQREEIASGTQKIRDACQKADIAIKQLKDKEDKTIEDYKKLVVILESRMKLMKDF